MLYYIHGYQSNPDSAKGTLFKEKLDAKAIQYRDCKPEDIVISDCLKRIANEIEHDTSNRGSFGMSYEQGVSYALDWVLGNIDEDPIED